MMSVLKGRPLKLNIICQTGSFSKPFTAFQLKEITHKQIFLYLHQLSSYLADMWMGCRVSHFRL